MNLILIATNRKEEWESMKDIKRVSIYKDGKLVERTKIDYSHLDKFCEEYRASHDGAYTFKVELLKFRV